MPVIKVGKKYKIGKGKAMYKTKKSAVRAYAVNSAGTSYGTTVQVTTLKAFKPRTMWFN